MIEADRVSKRFGQTQAVDSVSLKVEAGQIFGLLGPNAAGKTTLIRLLCGLVPMDSGSSLINQLPVKKAKQQFGYVAQHFGQYEELTVWENLTFYARLYGIHDTGLLENLLHQYGLMQFRNHFAGTLSGGYQRRLALACAVSHDPDVLFLDEPTAGIDPVTRKSLWDEFYTLSAQGKTLFITTHYMEEAERCHGLAFLSAGKLVAQGSPDAIKQQLDSKPVICCSLPNAPALIPELRRTLDQLDAVLLTNQFGNVIRVVSQNGLTDQQIRNQLPCDLADQLVIEESSVNLEDAFIALTQNRHSSL